MREKEVVESVVSYFNEPRFSDFIVDTEETAPDLCAIQFGSGSVSGSADVVLHNDGHLVTIVECKTLRPNSPQVEQRHRAQLKSYLSATDTRFGVLAYTTNSENWIFCENLRSHKFRIIQQPDFERDVFRDPTEDRRPKEIRRWRSIAVALSVAAALEIRRWRSIAVALSVAAAFLITLLVMLFGKAPPVPPRLLPEMAIIPAGEFQMGSNDKEADHDEQPVHTVYLDTFSMDVHEVTNAQYKQFVDANPEWQKDRIPSAYHDGNYLKYWEGNDYPQGQDNHPVVYVSWYAAMAYADWVGKRLPTEAEWEKAARGGLISQAYSWGNFIDPSKANYSGEIGGTTPVGNYSANEYGLYDMVGNVWEWCLDVYREDFYSVSSRRNPIAGESVTELTEKYLLTVKDSRVVRSGYWFNQSEYVRVADRYKLSPDETHRGGGFRCVRTVDRM